MNKVKCRIYTIQSIVQIISDNIDMIKLCGVKGQKRKTCACVVKHISSGHWPINN
jgi:hypothetical protein